jgi:hypothetical protein
MRNVCLWVRTDQTPGFVSRSAITGKTGNNLRRSRPPVVTHSGHQPPPFVRERVQRLKLVTPRPEPVTETQKLRFIDRCQDCNHCRLDDLVLQSGDAERPLSAIRLRYVRPARWQRSIRSCVNTSVKICEVGLDVLHVVGPRHLVDTRRSGPLQIEEARPQNIDADVMQERRQLALSVPGDGISYAGLRL